MSDTKAAWRRRALKAETELETLHRIRKFEHGQEITLSHVNAALSTAFREIQDVLAWVREQDPTAGR